MMSAEDAIRQLSHDPALKPLLFHSYIDEDVVCAALRFARGEEFQTAASLVWAAGIRPPARVLDLGAGRGIASLAWALRGYDVTAVEPDPSALVGSGAIRQLQERTNIPITVVEDVGEHLPLADGSFDLVYVRQTLHHASDLHQMCAEAARVLRRNGVLLATREHVVSGQRQLVAFLGGHPVHRLTGGENAYTLAHYTRALRHAGFRHIRTLGPVQSPINLYPDTPASIRLIASGTARRMLGDRVGPLVACLPLYYLVWAYLASTRLGAPGRMHSFIARK